MNTIYDRGVGRDIRFPLPTVQTHFFCFFHIHQSPHAFSTVPGTYHSALLKNIINLVGIVYLFEQLHSHSLYKFLS